MQSLLMSNELAGWLQMTVAILKRRQKMQLTLSLLALLYYECNVTSQPFRKIAFLNGIGKAGQDSKKNLGVSKQKKDNSEQGNFIWLIVASAPVTVKSAPLFTMKNGSLDLLFLDFSKFIVNFQKIVKLSLSLFLSLYLSLFISDR